MNKPKKPTDHKMSFSEHMEEFSQRFIFCIASVGVAFVYCLIDVNSIAMLFESLANGVKFLQYAPGIYFFATLKLAAFCGVILNSPLLLYQLLLYTLPGLTKTERNVVVPVSFFSGILFFIGLFFSYFLIIPSALVFLTSYGSNVVEPFWSFEPYFDFISVLMFISGMAFQIPAIQILLGALGVVTGKKMLAAWRNVLVFVTVLAAIVTPSTDPITQLLFSSALLVLYLLGASLLMFFKK